VGTFDTKKTKLTLQFAEPLTLANPSNHKSTAAATAGPVAHRITVKLEMR
jgi:hypothetical protein